MALNIAHAGRGKGKQTSPLNNYYSNDYLFDYLHLYVLPVMLFNHTQNDLSLYFEAIVRSH